MKSLGKGLKFATEEQQNRPKQDLQSHSVIYYQVKMNFEDNIWTLTTTKPLHNLNLYR